MHHRMLYCTTRAESAWFGNALARSLLSLAHDCTASSGINSLLPRSVNPATDPEHIYEVKNWFPKFTNAPADFGGDVIMVDE